MNTTSQRRLAAILAADVAGYTQLVEDDTDGTVAAWKSARDDIIKPLVSEKSGHIIKFTGDGFLVEFSSVQDAVACAINLQTRLMPGPLDFRMGVNLGDITDDGGDVHGEGVNIAARLEALCHPGGVFISGMVFDAIRNRIDVSFCDLGEHNLKHVSAPVRVFKIEGLGKKMPEEPISDFQSKAKTTSLAMPSGPSIAVLPFDNMSGDTEQEYFSDGITEDIITELSRISSLMVIARNSTFTYKDTKFNVSDVCADLGVLYALEGSVRKAGNRVRITAQLIEGATGGHLWAERYDRELDDIFEVQDEVTQQIVNALKIKLTPKEQKQIAENGTDNFNAHDLFLKARALFFGAQRDSKIFDQSLKYFQQAMKLDPDYAAAISGVAFCNLIDYQNQWSDASKTALQKADEYSKKALAKNADDPFPYYVDGIVGMYSKDYDRWATSSERALELNPNYALAINLRGLVHVYSGDGLSGIPFINRAMRLDPAFNLQYMHFLGTAYFVADDYETAISIFKARVTIDPTTDLSRAFLAAIFGLLGRMTEARQTWDELMKINQDYDPQKHMDRLPFKRAYEVDKFLNGLRQAKLIDSH